MNSNVLLFVVILCLFAVTSDCRFKIQGLTKALTKAFRFGMSKPPVPYLGNVNAVNECYECSTYNVKDNGQCANFDAATSPKSRCRHLLDHYPSFNVGIRPFFPITPKWVKYGCIKVVSKNSRDNKEYYRRTCVKRVEEVHNDCDLLKENIPENVKVVTCNVCINEDNCNEASYLVQSFVLIVFAIFIANNI